jgi:N-acetyl-anhydromuramyl-L-alanine amidase AmpD
MKFVQARNYTRGPRRCPIDLIVLHSMEAAEKPDTAEAVAGWFACASAPKASAHFCVDCDSIVQCVRVQDIAWHAKGANHNGVGIELAGYAKQTTAQWKDEYSSAMLELAASLVGRLCADINLPAEYVDANDIKLGKRGITTHADVTRAFKIPGGHTDPGPNFPMQDFIYLVRGYVVYPDDTLHVE